MGSAQTQSRWIVQEKNQNFKVLSDPEGRLVQLRQIKLLSTSDSPLVIQQYNLRKKLFGSNRSNVLKVVDVQVDSKFNLCSSTSTVKLYTERIIAKLQDLIGLEESKGLFLIHQASAGFQELKNSFSLNFQPKASMIFITQSQQIKVWLNHIVQKNNPQENIRSVQQQFCEKLCNIIENSLSQKFQQSIEKRLKKAKNLKQLREIAIKIGEQNYPHIMTTQIQQNEKSRSIVLPSGYLKVKTDGVRSFPKIRNQQSQMQLMQSEQKFRRLFQEEQLAPTTPVVKLLPYLLR